ncbi:MAG: NAD(P)H-dependent oxidoreductase subunit E [Planctomycetota bacterium]|nr:NAD(P)H-dependent oxidoreductase subunit E [Planctomycetota bacterium]
METDGVQTILHQHREDRGGLIAILQDVQRKYSYLPPDVLREIADRTGRSLVDIYGVATFYKSFSLEPRGEHLCSVCMGTACHVRGAPSVAEEFQRRLGIPSGGTTPDRAFTLETVNCLGACALGPVVVVDGHYFSHVNTTKVTDIIERARAGLDDAEIKEHMRHYLYDVSCSRCNHSLMDPTHRIDGAPSIRVTASAEGEHGWLRLSALYGSFTVESEFGIRTDTVVDFFCPHCHAELKSPSRCPLCRAPMVTMIVRSGGILQICSRRGCKGHMLDLEGGGF